MKAAERARVELSQGLPGAGRRVASHKRPGSAETECTCTVYTTQRNRTDTDVWAYCGVQEPLDDADADGPWYYKRPTRLQPVDCSPAH